MKMFRVKQVKTVRTRGPVTGAPVYSFRYYPEYRTWYWPFWRSVVIPNEGGLTIVGCDGVFEAWEVIDNMREVPLVQTKYFYGSSFKETAP